ncbi:hypothetical protein PtB15_17B151 [Puccinia triticina]|nr:hypothetical protein PtB15_17B151 [Puccinia triticina]
MYHPNDYGNAGEEITPTGGPDPDDIDPDQENAASLIHSSTKKLHELIEKGETKPLINIQALASLAAPVVYCPQVLSPATGKPGLARTRSAGSSRYAASQA